MGYGYTLGYGHGMMGQMGGHPHTDGGHWFLIRFVGSLVALRSFMAFVAAPRTNPAT